MRSKTNNYGQADMIQCIYNYSQLRGVSPSMRELSVLMDPPKTMSTSLVRYYLNKLQEGGYVTREPKISRAVIITSKGLELIGVGRNNGLRIIKCPHCQKLFDDPGVIVAAPVRKQPLPAMSRTQ